MRLMYRVITSIEVTVDILEMSLCRRYCARSFIHITLAHMDRNSIRRPSKVKKWNFPYLMALDKGFEHRLAEF